MRILVTGGAGFIGSALVRAAAQGGFALTSTCPSGVGSLYSLASASVAACCPAPGTTLVSASLGCAPDASVGGPLDTKFAFSGYAAEGVLGFSQSGSPAPTFTSDRFNTPGRALAVPAGAGLDATQPAIAANMPSGNAAMSASAWA